jgi:hypothetical protein
MDQARSQAIDLSKKGTGGSMKLMGSVGILVVALMIPGCTDSKTSELEQKLSGVETKINEMQSTVDYQRTRMARFQVEKDRYSKVYLDASSKGFQRLDTNCGTFWVMLDDIEPYPDGYKLVLSIGNPYYAVFSGMKTLARWGPAFDGNVSEKDVSAYEAWEKTLKEKEETVTHALRPGTWNKMTVILAPAKQEDLAYVEFSMTVEQVKLGDSKK